MTKVLIVDDDAYVRKSLRIVLTSQGLVVIGEADDGDQVPDQIALHRPDVVLIDLQMARIGGIEAIRRNASRPQAPRFVALTNFGTEETVMQALEAGAAGFLAKDDDPEELASHLNAVVGGGTALSSGAATTVVSYAASFRRNPKITMAREQFAELTSREREVAVLLAGRTHVEIARCLGISKHTVKIHLDHARTKLGLADGAALAVVAALANLES